MYQTFYHLSADPFRLTPDPRFCFHHQAYAKAWAYLHYALQVGEGFTIVTGQPGTGKTTLIEALIEELNHFEDIKYSKSMTFMSRKLNGTKLDAMDLLRSVAYSFGVDSETSDRFTLIHRLEQYLIGQCRNNRRVLLLIDEAHGISDTALEELRLLADLQSQRRPLLQMFLIGQEGLLRILDTPVMEQFQQRVLSACHLANLSLEETRDFIEHRLRCANWKGDPVISGEAISSIHLHSRGLPRHINKVCSRLMLRGDSEEKHVLGQEDVMAIVEELDDEQLSPLCQEQFENKGHALTETSAAGCASERFDDLAVEASAEEQTRELRMPAEPCTGRSRHPQQRDMVYAPVYSDFDVQAKSQFMHEYVESPRPRQRPSRTRRRIKDRLRVLRLLRVAWFFAVKRGGQLWQRLDLAAYASRLDNGFRESVSRGANFLRDKQWSQKMFASGGAFVSRGRGLVRTQFLQLETRRAAPAVVAALILCTVALWFVGTKAWRDAADPADTLVGQEESLTEELERHPTADESNEQNGGELAISDRRSSSVTEQQPVDQVVASYLQTADYSGGDPFAAAVAAAMAPDAGAVISAKVSYDLDPDGAHETSIETGIPDVTVELRDLSGEAVASSVTDSEGIYRFVDVAEGDYVRVVTDFGRVLFGKSMIKGLMEQPITVYETPDGAPVVVWKDLAADAQSNHDTVAVTASPGDRNRSGEADDESDAHRFAPSVEISLDSALPWQQGFDALTSVDSDNRAMQYILLQPSDEFATFVATPRGGDADSTMSAIDGESAPATLAEPNQVSEDPDGSAEPGQDAVPKLLSAAKLALEQDRLSIPGDDSAFYYYKKILEVDPASAEASAGMDRIVERYIELAEDAFELKSDEEARRYIARGLRVQPGHQGLLALQERGAVVVLAEVTSAAPEVAPEPQPQGFIQKLKTHLSGNDNEPAMPATGDVDGR